METEKRFNLNEWLEKHKKGIYMSVGAIAIARISYKQGYKKGQDEIMIRQCISLLNGFVAIVTGGTEWTK